ncbi:MAG: twin-arginine translocase subunit TatC [Anaerolineaceae bacterium]|nr:twin-arginine translocase subunit TatC [Anaerolineaceae bacterium]
MSEAAKTDPKEMSFFAHIEELRKRLLIALISLAVGVSVSLFFGEKAVAILTLPIGGLDKLQSIEITENIGVYMRVSLLLGVILAFPMIIYQLLLFVLPGLNIREKRLVLLAIPFATLFFLAGVAFAYFVMLPAALPFLINFLGVTTNPRLSSYISFITDLLFWIGVVFELPLLIYVIARFGLLTPKSMLRYWRQAIVIIAILAAIITPTVDPVNMSLMMLPLVVLYFISVLFAWLANRNRNRQDPESV